MQTAQLQKERTMFAGGCLHSCLRLEEGAAQEQVSLLAIYFSPPTINNVSRLFRLFGGGKFRNPWNFVGKANKAKKAQ